MPKVKIRIAKEGWPLIAGFALVALAGSLLFNVLFLTLFLWTATGWSLWFFRDPERRVPEGEGLIIAPADGRIVAVEEVISAPITHQPARKVSVFMNVFNVHVNRSPAAGRISKRVYHRGRFVNAVLDKASSENERMEILLEMEPDGDALPFVQVAGLVARRIVCRSREGDLLARGERFGLIRFGSRVDLYLPLTASVQIVLGDKTVAGETIIARMQTES